VADASLWCGAAAIFLIAASMSAGVAQATADTVVENTLVNSSPENGSSITTSPTEIIIGFAEELGKDGNTIALSCTDAIPLLPIEVLDDEKSLRVEVAQPLPKGTCTASWSVTAPDGSPNANGVLSFIVLNDPAPTTSDTGTVAANATAPPTTAVGATAPVAAGDAQNDPEVVDFSVATHGQGAVWLGRLLSTIGIATLFGALLVITAAWPEGVEYLITIKFLRAVWIFAVIGTLLFTATASSAVTPEGGGSGFNPGTWLDLLDAGWAGRAVLLRLVFLLASAWVAFRPDRTIDPTSQMVALGIPALCAATLGISRTVGSLPALGVLMGIAHALAMSIWVGGVILLARVVLSGPGDEDLVHAVRGFSRISTPAIAVTIVTGVVQMIRLDGGELFSSGHGRVVVLKAVVVAVMIFVAISARQFVTERLNRAQVMSVPLADRMRRTFGAEAGIGLLALALSSWLLALGPPNASAESSGDYPVRQTHVIDAADLDIDLGLTGETVGNIGLRVDVREAADGLTGLVLVFTAPPNALNVGSIRQPVPLTGEGAAIRAESIGLPISVAGDWTIRIDATTASGTVSSAPQTFSVANADNTGSSTSAPPPQSRLVEIPATSPPTVTTVP
jgi:copper transport protein